MFAVLLVFLLVPFFAQAETGGGQIIHQGLLLDGEEVPLGEEGTEFCFKFSIYDDESLGLPDIKLWPEGKPAGKAVMVKKGFFSVILGDSGEPLNLPAGRGANLFLQIEVANKVGDSCADSDEEFEVLEPRQAISWADVSECVCTRAPSFIFSSENTAVDEGGPLCTAKTFILEQDGRIYLPDGENQIVGGGAIPSGENEVFIPNSSIENNSKIILTPTSFLSTPLYIKEKKAGEGFVVATALQSETEIIFDWIVFHVFSQKEETAEQIINSDNMIEGAVQSVVNIDGGASGPLVDGGLPSKMSANEEMKETASSAGSSTLIEAQELFDLADTSKSSSSSPSNYLENESKSEPFIEQTLEQ